MEQQLNSSWTGEQVNKLFFFFKAFILKIYEFGESVSIEQSEVEIVEGSFGDEMLPHRCSQISTGFLLKSEEDRF